MARFRGPVLVILTTIVVLAIGDTLWKGVSAVVACVNPDKASAGNAWPSGTISVNISGFPSALQPCVKSAFDNWNTSNQASSPTGNGTGVKLQTVFDGPTLTTGATGGTNVYQVTYGTTTNSSGSTVNALGSTHDFPNSSGTSLKNAKTEINSNMTNCTAITQTTAHEIGHTMGLGECTKCTQPQQSVMIAGKCAVFSGGICIIPDWNDTTFGLPGPTSCDNSTVHSVYNPPPTQIPGCNPDCPIGSRTCIPCGASPIVLDLDRNGFDLTGAADGVFFDISGTGNLVQMGWTARGSDDGFLALPGTDGLVHSGKQLFGNFTAQPVSSAPNGFAALAVYDDPKNGGNGDGLIDSKDSIFEFLRIWVDTNHDGISQPEELHTLPSLGVNSISLSYKESRRTDQYGNVFRYRARVNEENPQDLGPTAYDVFFVEITTTSKGILGGLILGPIQRPTPSNGSLLTAIAWLRRPTDGRDLAQ